MHAFHACDWGSNPHISIMSNKKVLYILQNILNVQITDFDKISNYINTYSNSEIDIVYAAMRIREEYGNDVTILINLKDVFNNDNPILVLTVRQNPYEDDLMDRLDEINNEVYTYTNNKSICILLTTDFHYSD